MGVERCWLLLNVVGSNITGIVEYVDQRRSRTFLIGKYEIASIGRSHCRVLLSGVADGGVAPQTIFFFWLVLLLWLFR